MNLQRRRITPGITRAVVPLATCVVAGLTAVSCASPDGGRPTTGPATTPVAPVAITDAAVQIAATGCGPVEVHGAGLMVADGKIATVAHVVAGAKTIEVRGAHGKLNATVVFFDPVLDLAVLKVDAGFAPVIPIGSANAGDSGSVVVYRDDAPVVLPASVQRPVNIRTADIYGQDKHIRPGFELNLKIQAGDSGAVVVMNGRAVALVWATSHSVTGRAWAMRASLLQGHTSADTMVANGDCV
ncbi:MAG: trypsin-like peptidase domain-containing protein [Ilumatobacteraceae bacterium]